MNYLDALAHLICSSAFSVLAYKELSLKRPNKWEGGFQVGAAVLFGAGCVLNLI
jgi:hypothetical protein